MNIPHYVTEILLTGLNLAVVSVFGFRVNLQSVDFSQGGWIAGVASGLREQCVQECQTAWVGWGVGRLHGDCKAGGWVLIIPLWVMEVKLALGNDASGCLVADTELVLIFKDAQCLTFST